MRSSEHPASGQDEILKNWLEFLASAERTTIGARTDAEKTIAHLDEIEGDKGFDDTEWDKVLDQADLLHEVHMDIIRLQVEVEHIKGLQTYPRAWFEVLKQEFRQYRRYLLANQMSRIFKSNSIVSNHNNALSSFSEKLASSWYRLSSLRGNATLDAELDTTGNELKTPAWVAEASSNTQGELPSTTSPNADLIDTGVPFDLPDWIQEAHEAVLRTIWRPHASKCQNVAESIPIRIGLKAYRALQSGNPCYVSTSLGGAEADFWQEAEFRVTKPISGFVLCVNGGAESGAIDENNVVTCLICECMECQGLEDHLHFAVTCTDESRLLRLDYTPCEGQWVDLRSLGDIISGEYHLNALDKRLLATRLSYALLHFSNAKWLLPYWTSSNIVFPVIKKHATGDKERLQLSPYIQLQTATSRFIISGQVTATSSTTDSFNEHSSRLYHPFPFLVVLATQLMEIYAKASLKLIADRYDVRLSERTDDIALFRNAKAVCDKMIQSGALSNADQILFKAIQSCLEAPDWKKLKDEVEVRTAIATHVVHYVETHLVKSHENVELMRLEDTSDSILVPQTGRHTVSPPANPRKETRQPFLPSHPAAVATSSPSSGAATTESGSRQMFDNFQTSNTKEFKDAYAAWSDELIRVYDKFPCEPSTDPSDAMDNGKRPVRIAVIDSGYDFDHAEFQIDLARIIKTCCFDCLDHPDSCIKDHMRDTNGHGTHVLGLLLDSNRDTQIFIVKLDEADEDDSETSRRRVAKAIDLVVNAWDVDIVSLSFGYNCDTDAGYEAIKKSVKRASRKALIFAAARNSGLNQGRAYPADEPAVFCVHSTTHNGHWSDFNPDPLRRDLSLNLATIGEGVFSYWPTGGTCEITGEAGMKIRSGTSFACPIAASIAAFLIRFACVHLDAWQAQKVRTFDGMNAVLRTVCNGSTDARAVPRLHSYLKLSIHPDNFFGNGNSLEEMKEALGTALQATSGG